jgi:hypothetical protein
MGAKNKMKAIQIAGLITTLVVSGLATADNVYKSVDEDGNVAFSDRPDADWEETVELSISHTNPDQIKQENKADAEMATAIGIRVAGEAEGAAEQANRQAKLAQQRATQCEAAQKRSEKYNTHRRLYKELPNGEREYLNDDELDTARVDAARSVDELCS